MPAPVRLVARIGELNISAYILEEVLPIEAGKITCKNCAPRSTQVKQIAELIQYGSSEDLHWNIFRCRRCARQWALPFRMAIHAPEVQ